jgi:protein-L-isoaspartate(D-aspartate) O-methyltransferase
VNGEPDTRIIQLLMALRAAGVSDKSVLAAIERTPRDLFVPDGFQDQAFENRPLPIDCGQTISQPYVVGAMTPGAGP